MQLHIRHTIRNCFSVPKKGDSQYNFLRRDTQFATVATRNCLSRAAASCRKLSQAVARHLSQKLKKAQLLRHATRDIHKWSTVSTLGARAMHVQSTTCAYACRKHENDCEPRVAVAARHRCRKSHVARSCSVNRP